MNKYNYASNEKHIELVNDETLSVITDIIVRKDENAAGKIEGVLLLRQYLIAELTNDDELDGDSNEQQ